MNHLEYAIDIRNLNKWFSGLHALKDINVQVAEKEKLSSADRQGQVSPR